MEQDVRCTGLDRLFEPVVFLICTRICHTYYMHGHQHNNIKLYCHG
jgi:hypothetical protein